MPTLPTALIFLSMLVALYACHAIPVPRPQSPIPPITMSPTGDFQMQIQPNQFLMRNGTNATPSIVFTPTNGFIGQVSITLSVSPNIPNAPTAFFNYPIVTLNASMGGSPGYPLEINTTTNTPTGLYMVTATGRSGLLVHTGNATIGVTNVFIPGNGAELVYKLNFDSQPNPGSTIYFIGNFSDLGYVSIMVSTITVQFSFGTYGGYHGQGLLLEPYKTGILSFAVTIPANAIPGSYPYTATISWVLGPYTISQTQQPDIVTHSSLQVYPSTTALPYIPFPMLIPFLLPAIVLEVLFSAFSILLVHRHENLKRAGLRNMPSRN